MKAAILIAAMVVGCSQQGAPEANDQSSRAVSGDNVLRGAHERASAPSAKPFSVEEENDLYNFSYSWPVEGAAVPELAAKFTKEMNDARAELIADAKADRDGRRKAGFDYLPHETQGHYETAGQSDRLLSLEYSLYGFTGGAHGSTASGAFLWDRAQARQIQIQDLLQSGASWVGAIRQPFCVLLDREREERRGEPVDKSDMFGNCPDYKEVTLLLGDEDKNGRFDHIHVIADQYVAGPYAEGPYEISLPITAAMIGRLKPEFQSSFEPKPPVK